MSEEPACLSVVMKEVDGLVQVGLQGPVVLHAFGDAWALTSPWRLQPFSEPVTLQRAFMHPARCSVKYIRQRRKNEKSAMPSITQP
jgi:hypothetical protein